MKKLIIISIVACLTPAGWTQKGRNIQIKPVDRDGDGRFSLEEMCDGIEPALKPAIMESMKRLDQDGDGFIAKEEMFAASGKPAKRGPTASDDECGVKKEGTCTVTRNPKAETPSYAVLVSAKTYSDTGWKTVVDALVKKHAAHVVIYEGSVMDAKSELRKLEPRYLAVVTRPEITGRVIVQRLHQLTRAFDDDPYGDAVWGIITADTPERALAIVQSEEPKKVTRALNLTGVKNELYQEVFTISDGKVGDWYWKQKDGAIKQGAEGNADRTALFLKQFNEMKPDLIVSSGHATEKNLEMCFSRGNTIVRNGRWYVKPLEGKPELIPESNVPRVFVGAGNCLIGNMDRTTNSMACVMISHYGFNQFLGYTVPTWYGKGGWGTLGLWQSEGGYSLAESWFFNNQIILNELLTRFPKAAQEVMTVSEDGQGFPMAMNRNMEKDAAGMIWDRDVVAFFGDPKHRILAGNQCVFEVNVKKTGKRTCLTIKALKDLKDGPAVGVWLPSKMKGVLLAKSERKDVVLTDDFILVSKPTCKAGEAIVLELTCP